MKYMVSAFGYLTGKDQVFDTKEEAEAEFNRRVTEMCKACDRDITPDYEPISDDVTVQIEDEYFLYGHQGKGARIFAIHEIPDFNSKAEELLWKAQYMTIRAEYAMIHYEFMGGDNFVTDYTSEARALIGDALKELKS